MRLWSMIELLVDPTSGWQGIQSESWLPQEMGVKVGGQYGSLSPSPVPHNTAALDVGKEAQPNYLTKATKRPTYVG